MAQFEVQHYTLCDGWINCWTDGETGEPSVYKSYEVAKEVLDQFLRDEDEAYFNGDVESRFTADEFRIVEVK